MIWWLLLLLLAPNVSGRRDSQPVCGLWRFLLFHIVLVGQNDAFPVSKRLISSCLLGLTGFHWLLLKALAVLHAEPKLLLLMEIMTEPPGAGLEMKSALLPEGILV